VPENEVMPSAFENPRPDIPGGFASEDEERVINDCNEWVARQGLPAGEILYELVDPKTGEPLAVLDIAWPNGLQEGLSQPVALLLDEEKETENAVNGMGFRYFNTLESFKDYIIREILGSEKLAA